MQFGPRPNCSHLIQNSCQFRITPPVHLPLHIRRKVRAGKYQLDQLALRAVIILVNQEVRHTIPRNDLFRKKFREKNNSKSAEQVRPGPSVTVQAGLGRPVGPTEPVVQPVRSNQPAQSSQPPPTKGVAAGSPASADLELFWRRPVFGLFLPVLSTPVGVY